MQLQKQIKAAFDEIRFTMREGEAWQGNGGNFVN